jgi:hypothetical protein
MTYKHFGRLSTSIVLSFLASSLTSEELNDGIKAYNAGSFGKAFAIFSSHAGITHPMAMYYLCTLYLSGKGIEQNEYIAFDYCKRAAEEGIVDAQFQLGLMYLNAIGIVQEDDDKALEWLRKAANGGHSEAKEMFDFLINRDFTYGC